MKQSKILSVSSSNCSSGIVSLITSNLFSLSNSLQNIFSNSLDEHSIIVTIKHRDTAVIFFRLFSFHLYTTQLLIHVQKK